jgi:hypothetical protein
MKESATPHKRLDSMVTQPGTLIEESATPHKRLDYMASELAVWALVLRE